MRAHFNRLYTEIALEP